MNDLDKYFEKARNVEPDISQDDTRKILAGKLSDGGITTNLYHKIRTYPMITTLITSAAIVGVLMLSQFAEPTGDNNITNNDKIQVLADNYDDGIVPEEENGPKARDIKKEKEFQKKHPAKPVDKEITKKTKIKKIKLDSRDNIWTSDEVDVKQVNTLQLTPEELRELGIVIERDNFKVNAFDKYAFTIYANNEKEREYFDEDRDKDAFPTPAMVTTASGFKTLTLFKNEGIEAIVDRVKSDDGKERRMSMTTEIKQNQSMKADPNLPKFNFNEMSFDDYKDKLSGRKDSAFVVEQINSLEDFKLKFGNKEITLDLQDFIKQGGMDPNKAEQFINVKTLEESKMNSELDVNLTMEVNKTNGEQLGFLRHISKSSDNLSDEQLTEILDLVTSSEADEQLLNKMGIVDNSTVAENRKELDLNSHLSPGQKIWVEEEDSYKIFIERLDTPDPNSSLNRMNYIVGKDTVKIEYSADIKDSQTGTSIMMPEGFTKKKDYDEHKKRLNTYLELLGNNPSASMFKGKTKYKSPITKLELTDLNGNKNVVDLLKQALTSNADSTEVINKINDIVSIKVQYKFNTYTIDFQQLLKNYNGELDFDNDPNLEFLKEDIDPKLAKRKNYSTKPVISWLFENKKQTVNQEITDDYLINLYDSLTSNPNTQHNDDVFVRDLLQRSGDKVIMKKISSDNQSENYSVANEEVNIDLEKILSQEYTNKEVEKILAMEEDVVEVQIMYNDNENREYIIPNEKEQREEFLRTISNRIENESTDKPIVKSLKVYVDSTKINSMLYGTPLSKFDSKPDMLIGGNLGMNDNVKHSNMSFSIIKHDINKLIPIEVNLDDDKTNFIVWYEATDEFLEKLPSRLIQKINPELSAADDQAEHCNNEPVKKDDAVMDVWSGCSGAIKGMKLFPNPAVGQSSVELSLEEDRNLSIAIYNLSGQLIKRLDTPTQYSKGQLNKPLDLNGIDPGLYYVVVKSELGEQALQRIIIE